MTQRIRTPRLTAVLVAGLAVSALGACSGGDSPAAPAATVTETATVTSSPSSTGPSSTGAEGTPAGNGCAPNSAEVPAGARTASAPDLDLDGDDDEIWLTDAGGRRELGVRTATGNVFSTTFTSAAPQAARAIGARVDGASIVLLDTGRSVSLYAFVNCELVPSENAQGQPYTFDKGFTGYGTGVACVDLPQGLTLAGLLAKEATGGRFDVVRTDITLTDYGRQARNGSQETVARGVAGDGAQVEAARSVECGTDNPGATEPQ